MSLHIYRRPSSAFLFWSLFSRCSNQLSSFACVAFQIRDTFLHIYISSSSLVRATVSSSWASFHIGDLSFDVVIWRCLVWFFQSDPPGWIVKFFNRVRKFELSKKWRDKSWQWIKRQSKSSWLVRLSRKWKAFRNIRKMSRSIRLWSKCCKDTIGRWCLPPPSEFIKYSIQIIMSSCLSTSVQVSSRSFQISPKINNHSNFDWSLKLFTRVAHSLGSSFSSSKKGQVDTMERGKKSIKIHSQLSSKHSKSQWQTSVKMLFDVCQTAVVVAACNELK